MVRENMEQIQKDPIVDVLDDLMKYDDVLACMLAYRNTMSDTPSGGFESFKPGINEVWDNVQQAMRYLFLAIGEGRGITEMNFNICGYEALLYVLPDTETALVAIVPNLCNKGLIDVALDQARQEIKKIFDEKAG